VGCFVGGCVSEVFDEGEVRDGCLEEKVVVLAE
jgi:hypothetical protein